MTSPFWVYTDKARDLCLIRGYVRDLLADADVLDRARWSPSARGWVLTDSDAAQLCVVAEMQDRPYRCKDVVA